MTSPKSRVLADAINWARNGEAISAIMDRAVLTNTTELDARYDEHLDFAAALARRATTVGGKDADCVAVVAAVLIERDTGWAPSRIAVEANCTQQVGALERHVLAASINASPPVMAILAGNGAVDLSDKKIASGAHTTAGPNRSVVETPDGQRRLKLRRVSNLGVLARKLCRMV